MKIESTHYVIYDDINDALLVDEYNMIMTFKDVASAVELCRDGESIIMVDMLPSYWKRELLIDKLIKSK